MPGGDHVKENVQLLQTRVRNEGSKKEERMRKANERENPTRKKLQYRMSVRDTAT